MNSRIKQLNVQIVATVAIGLLLAVVLGVVIGNHDYYLLTTDLHDYWTLIFAVTFVGVILYVGFLQHFTWEMALLLCYLGILFRPLGFDIGPTELTCALGGLLALMSFWQRRSQRPHGLLRNRRFDLVKTLLFFWIIYAVIHMGYNIYFPVKPGEFALKNALKSYFETIGPPILLWYFALCPASIRIKGNILRTLSYIVITGLIFNLAISAYGIATHHNLADPDAIDYTPSFWIGGINARENPYMLRTLGPAAVLLGTVTITLDQTASRVSRKLSFFLIALGFTGCLLSAGRAAVTVSVALVLVTLILTQRYRASWTILGFAAITVLIVNVFSGWINRNAPVPILRPLQWVMLNKNEYATNSIESSSRWREELFRMAIDEWKSSPRTFWFGRATYGFGVNDVFAYQISGQYKAALESSLRRGATHNLITELLVTYGLVGCILYYCIMLAIIRFLWYVYRSGRAPTPVQPIALFCLIIYVSNILIATVQGGTFLPDIIWLLILLITALNHFTLGDDLGLMRPGATDSAARAVSV